MPRQPRIQYEGAFYHILARGDRKEPIVQNDKDRNDFIATLSRACERTGWNVHAWVLMENHYHLLLETPKANLVDGMKWFQNTYTRRYNVRNNLWGHVFGGRYKSILLDPADGNGYYYQTLLDYIHLNPARAGIAGTGKKFDLSTYPWSSLSSGYLKTKNTRAGWLDVTYALETMGFADTPRGRKKYLDHLISRVQKQRTEHTGTRESDDLNSTLQRGWYWGSKMLKDRLLKLTDPEMAASNQNYKTSPLSNDYAKNEAERLIADRMEEYQLTHQDLKELAGSDKRKVMIADEIHRTTTVSQSWIAEKLFMKSANNVSALLHKHRNIRNN